MKTISVCAAFILLFSACENGTINTGPGSENKITGSGNVIMQTREMGSFDRIETNGVFNVILDQGAMEVVKVETDDNLQDLIITEVKNNELMIRMKDSSSFGKITKMNVFVTLKDISGIKTEGVGSIKCLNTLHLKNIELKCDGVGNTSLDLDAERIDIKTAIVGVMELKGRAKHVCIDHDGIGGIQAFGLQAENMELKIDGVGGAEVFASNELKIEANGVGGVKYKGNPKVKNIEAKGIGKVSSAE